jgi:hypothetical protein
VGTLLCYHYQAAHAGPLAVSTPPGSYVAINKGAGRGDLLVVDLQLGNGGEVSCIVDTGSPITVFDRALESNLEKLLGTEALWSFGDRRKINVYAAPALYLRDTSLLTGSRVFTFYFKRLPLAAESPQSGFR